MKRAHAYQAVASIFVLGLLVCAQAAAILLALHPASETLWYANRSIFSFFGIGWRISFVSVTGMGMSFALVALSLIAFRRRWMLVAGAISHLCLAVAALMFRADELLFAGFRGTLPRIGPDLLAHPGWLVMIAGMTAAFTSVILSHAIYWRIMRQRAN